MCSGETRRVTISGCRAPPLTPRWRDTGMRPLSWCEGKSSPVNMRPSHCARGPVLHHRLMRHVQNLRHLLVGQAGEELEFHHAARPLIDLLEPAQQDIEFLELKFPRARIGHDFQRNAHVTESALQRAPTPRMIDQHLAHRARRDGEEVPRAVPLRGRILDQAEIGLMHQHARLEHVVRALVLEVTARQRVQPLINQREERVSGLDSAGPFIIRFVHAAIPCEPAGRSPVNRTARESTAKRSPVHGSFGCPDSGKPFNPGQSGSRSRADRVLSATGPAVPGRGPCPKCKGRHQAPCSASRCGAKNIFSESRWRAGRVLR